MSNCSSVCGSSAPAQGTSSGARLLKLLQDARERNGTSRSEGPRKPPPSPPPPPPSSASGGSGADAKSLFDLLNAGDADGDGSLSSDEIAQTPASGLMSDVFGLIDADGNGALNAHGVGTCGSAVDEALTPGELTATAAPQDSAGGGSATAASLSASVFQALIDQIGTSDDTTRPAHQYTHVLQALKG